MPFTQFCDANHDSIQAKAHTDSQDYDMCWPQEPRSSSHLTQSVAVQHSRRVQPRSWKYIQDYHGRLPHQPKHGGEVSGRLDRSKCGPVSGVEIMDYVYYFGSLCCGWLMLYESCVRYQKATRCQIPERHQRRKMLECCRVAADVAIDGCMDLWLVSKKCIEWDSCAAVRSWCMTLVWSATSVQSIEVEAFRHS